MSLIEKLIRPEIRALSAYHVQDAAGLIKLDAMENPYEFDSVSKQAWLDQLGQININRYPHPSPQRIKDSLRDVFNISDKVDMLFGNGSDELIQILSLALSVNAYGKKACVLAPEPGFVMYSMIARYTNMDYIGVPLNQENFSLQLDDMLSAIKQHQPAIIYLAYPNNPTGNLFNPDDIKTIIAHATGLVVIDEAYNPFTGGNSFMPLVEQHDNVIVMRTVSKMGLAGLRFGYMAGAKTWMAEFDKVRMPYNINSLTQASIEFVLENKAVFDQQAELICKERKRLFTALQKLETVQAFPSDANFILFRVLKASPKDAQSVFDRLKKSGILIKNMHKSGVSLENCLRVTVGKPEENDAFLDALKSILA